MKRSDFFFCYDYGLAKYILSQDIECVTTAINPRSNLKFTLFVQSEQLNKAIKEYKQTKQS